MFIDGLHGCDSVGMSLGGQTRSHVYIDICIYICIYIYTYIYCRDKMRSTLRWGRSAMLNNKLIAHDEIMTRVPA